MTEDILELIELGFHETVQWRIKFKQSWDYDYTRMDPDTQYYTRIGFDFRQRYIERVFSYLKTVGYDICPARIQPRSYSPFEFTLIFDASIELGDYVVKRSLSYVIDRTMTDLITAVEIENLLTNRILSLY